LRFLAALRFLTIIPFPFWRDAKEEDIGHSAGYFPVVGILIGLIMAGLNWLLSLFLPAAIVNGLLLVYLVVVSGGLHIDGFIDTCDGIGGQKTAPERWQAMHDSRAGAFGITGAVLLLLLEYVSLNSVPRQLLPLVLVIMPVVSRWAMVYALFAYPYARPEGLGKIFKEGTNWRSFTMASVVTMVVTTALAFLSGIAYFYLLGLVILLITWLAVILMANYFKRKFAGLNGDNYGAINEVSEVLVLMLVVLLAHNQWLGLA